MTGRTVGEYHVADFIAAGGMGEVYRAVHTRLGRVVAIKFLNRAASHSGFSARFVNEARILGRLRHPNIAALYEFFEFEETPCIVMEYVEGRTLFDRIQAEGALPIAEAAAILIGIAEAIEYIHQQGIVHRDIKADNIKITSEGAVKLLDFGIARAELSQRMTQTGNVIGTLVYLSPEQLRGEADARSDIWALGVLYYEMLTGHLPFAEETLGGLHDRISHAVYTPPCQVNSLVPREAEAIVARCLKKRPSDRYATAGELLQEMRRLRARLADETSQPLPRFWPRLTIGGYRYWLLGAGLLTLLASGAVVVTRVPSSPPEKSVAPPPMPASGDLRTIQVDVAGGQADIYRDGNPIPIGKTPCQIEGRVGERIKLLLKQEGFEDKMQQITVLENNPPYRVPMEPHE